MTARGWKRFLVLAVCSGSTACFPEPKSEVQWGEHFQGKPLHVVLLPASCSSVSGDCADEHVTGVSGLVAGELEFARYTVTDAEKLVLSARTREDANVELSRFGERVLGVQSRVQAGSVFEDLSPSERRALLAEAKAEAIASVKIQIGPEQGGARENQVQIRVGDGDAGELLWVTRCSAMSAWHGSPSVAESLESAARCALDGVKRGKSP